MQPHHFPLNPTIFPGILSQLCRHWNHLPTAPFRNAVRQATAKAAGQLHGMVHELLLPRPARPVARRLPLGQFRGAAVGFMGN